MSDKLHRKIKSYVLRPGRITESQRKAIETLMPLYGVKKINKRIDLQKEFKNNFPIFINIGFGDGEEIVNLSTQNSEINYIGIEVHSPGVGRLLSSIDRLKIKNIRIIKADALEVVRDMISDASIEGVNIFFPDPWPKKKHHKRRIIQKKFVGEIFRILKNEGKFYICTDWNHYASHIENVMSEFEFFKKITKLSYRPDTKFERRGIRLGHKIINFEYKKYFT
ncbi:MAG: tRNA (guanosine(46)-N7)-methyltransferase TrmB [Gammaproteobacteria bacterium TMED78]|nr:MAG: tRNA (guanosine(46)-N7)-methyltransferase TrmB [Gammaproteobacteria bacterium TMED78]|tara:strand:- start:147 stop:815 length:669 start_codon:yes stop_codon:yes gene_type:complete